MLVQYCTLYIYVSKKIVDMMGGQMWVESDAGNGSTFYFTVPVATEVQLKESATQPMVQPANQTTAQPATTHASSGHSSAEAKPTPSQPAPVSQVAPVTATTPHHPQ